MGAFRSFSNNNPQYMPPQPAHMAAPMMIQPQFVTGAPGMVTPQMQMYPSGHGQFMPPGGTPQPMPGSNGYPSPGRPAAPMMVPQPAAPMMVPQGSQQGQPVYGTSPNVSYQQPVFTQQPAGQSKSGATEGYRSMTLTGQTVGRGYNNNPGPQHFGTSPQQMHQYGPQHRSGSANYGNKNFGVHGQHQVAQPSHPIPAGPHGRGPEVQDEAK